MVATLKTSYWTATILLLICCINVTSASVDCTTVLSLISGCSNYVEFGDPEPVLGTPCCDGMANMYRVASDSVENKRSTCDCLLGFITMYNPNATAVARLPGLCGVSLGFTIDPSTACGTIP
ncbi:hypothetical protein LUZ63_000701 [Rhynchospora breviuscula]|uniref:Bifunctional inhibitor/plant lipid transfer protein/seed storage helical domain-containing protein n=1 Tax=Rhynchospora breviuscula TaxID=2022672 RepID=A0A9Q0CVI4_9POAL|nr:hypothetical protein LUZ63_000701 [Rhynchospora breviuscula]